jgi:sugar phosphate isomerase/epimerase
MNSAQPAARLAVCSWSLQPTRPEELVARLRDTGISRVQLALDPLRESPAIWGATPTIFRNAGVEVVSGMFGTIGEDYSTLETIRLTGGVVPDVTWSQNLQNIKATAKIAASLGLKLVTFHAGFVPHDESDPQFARMLSRLREVAAIFEAVGIELGLETGQETAEALTHLLEKLNQPNVRVNFDPANMILYDKGDPIEALQRLGPWICQVHIKDAQRTRVPGTWGAEVAAGTGQVDWPAFFETLRKQGYDGNFVIEREAGTQRVADIRTAVQVVGNCCA